MSVARIHQHGDPCLWRIQYPNDSFAGTVKKGSDPKRVLAEDLKQVKEGNTAVIDVYIPNVYTVEETNTLEKEGSK